MFTFLFALAMLMAPAQESADLPETSAAALMSQCGEMYAWNRGDISAISRSVQGLEVIVSRAPATTAQVLAYMKALGLEPATCRELGAYRRGALTEPSSLPIVALGQDDEPGELPRSAATLAPNDHAFTIYEISLDGRYWTPGVAFLAIRRYRI